MFRQFVGDYEINAYVNREDYRIFMRAIKKDEQCKEIELLELMEKVDEQRESENV
jgi:hypothetical protein